jgi:hypothetical protein
MKTFQEKYQAKLDQYNKVFRLDELNDANDKSTLEIMLKTEIMIDDLQEEIQSLIDTGAVENATNIKKLADLLRDATSTITTLQRTLSIDRKTRKTEETASVADYIRTLKRDAKEFMERRIINFWCNDCKVMVGRVYPVHEHTSFIVSFQCDQCKKLIRGRRDERDVLFDVRDHQWRRKYRAEIVQPKADTKGISEEVEDELFISEAIALDDKPESESHNIMDDLELSAEE